MLKSKLFWKVLTNFGLLLMILTAMTVVTLILLSQIQRNFTIANADARSLQSLEDISTYLNNISASSYRYALAGDRRDKENYMEAVKEIRSGFTIFEGTFPDSTSHAEMSNVKENFEQWKLSVGDKLLTLGDERAVRKQVRDFELRMQELISLEVMNRYMDASRALVQTIQRARIPLQNSNIDSANSDSTRLSTFIIFINVLLAIFAIALGFEIGRAHV
jgi:CHASE3 domain sensor protein